MATFRASFSGHTETSSNFSARFSGGDKGYTGKRFVQLQVGGRVYTITGTNTSDGSGTSFYRTITGLSPGKTYSWYAKLGYGGSSSNIIWLDIYTDSGSFETKQSVAKPDTWSWTWSESNAFNSQGLITNLTASRWNSFIDRVNEAIEYGITVKKYSMSYVSSGSKMGSDKIMYASSFSAVAQGINTLCWRSGVADTSISGVSRGGTIYGWYFPALSAALNRAINAM